MTYPFLNTPFIRVYDMNGGSSVQAEFDETYPPEDFGNPETNSLLGQHRLMIYFFLPEYGTYLALAYLSNLWGNKENGSNQPPTEIIERRQILSFNIRQNSVQQLQTTEQASLVILDLIPEYWPDYLSGETEDNWEPPDSQYCAFSCSYITDTFLGYNLSSVAGPE